VFPKTIDALYIPVPFFMFSNKRVLSLEMRREIKKILSTYPKLISKILETMALASPYSGLKSPIPNEYNIGQVLI